MPPKAALRGQVGQPIESGSASTARAGRRLTPMQSAPTLFARLRRYRPRPGRALAEDRLTESLAATLEGAPDAARYLIREWFEGAERPSGPLRVRTQHWASPRERIDLELIFGPPGRPSLRVWLEAKVGAIPIVSRLSAISICSRSDRGSRGCFRLGWMWSEGTPERAPVHRCQELGTRSKSVVVAREHG